MAFASLLDGENIIISHDPAQNISDREAFTSCCGVYAIGSGLTPIGQCFQYIRYRPISNSWLFRAIAIAQARGDPHITTLDGLTYTFNGHGEYILLRTLNNTFQLQGRTEPVGNASAAGATVFTGFSAKLENGTTVQLSLNESRKSLELWVNYTRKDAHNWTITQTYEDVTLARDEEGLYTIGFQNDVVVKINASFTLGMLTFSLVMPSNLKNFIVGLMGNYDDDPSNDIFSSNGTAIPGNSTEEEIFHIAKTWAVNESTSLFAYGDSLDFDDFNKPDFTPTFFNSNLTAMFTNETERATAIDLCNPSGNGADSDPSVRKECYFDYLVTKNADAARATVAASGDLAKSRAEAANYPPSINNANATIQVVVGQSYPNLMVINATDRNNDNLTFAIDSGPANLSVSSDGTISWLNVAFSDNQSLVISVSDGKTQALFSPQVAICNCKNNASCQWDSEGSGNWYVAKCQCHEGWEGAFCEKDIDGCMDRPCFTACTDVPARLVNSSGNAFTCDPCPPGLSGDGRTCFDVNECLSSPKPCSQVCENTAGSFVCSCNEGYALGVDGRSCNDINECLLGKDECDAKATCANTVGGYNCTCNPGYQGSGHKGTCLNINECSTGAYNCTSNSKCADSEGSYTCACNFGYKKDGDRCVNIDECALGNNCDQKCIDAVASYSCACETGFILNSTDKVRCHPAAKCSSEEAATCDNNNSRTFCAKDGDNVICVCPKGYVLDSAKVCQDKNECATGEAICSAVTSTCVNTIYTNISIGYTCECKPGFRKSSDGVTCEDINECASPASHNCSHICKNIVGSYVCGCYDGSKLNANGFGCDDIDECSTSLTNDCDSMKGNCTNRNKTDGYPLGYECGCKGGYKLSADGFTCVDINECNMEGRGGCSQTCINADGSYSCICRQGFDLNKDNRACDDVDECSTNKHACYDTSHCNNTVGGYSCSCPDGFKLKADGFTCQSILECQPNNCSYSCSVLQGKDTCQCSRGYMLDPTNNITCIDIDECADNTLNTCPPSNNVRCVNKAPGFACNCTSSFYKQLEAARCVDIDECLDGSAKCPENSYCSNKNDGYDCNCEEGYKKEGDECLNINECASSGNNLCNKELGICSDTPGGYSCSCKPGYVGDGRTCTDSNECLSGTDTCERSPERGYCVNTVGSFTCGCNNGYKMTITNSCEDINECINRNTYNVTCKQECINSPGSYKCGCAEGFKLDADGISCSAVVACAPGNLCDKNLASCFKLNGTDTCTCNNGYKLASDKVTCEDINECVDNPISNSTCDRTENGGCSNINGFYTCSCKNGYIIGLSNECQDRDGGFGAWSEYGSCSHSCGDSGKKSRKRVCDNPTQKGSGSPCVGETEEFIACNRSLCQEHMENGVEIKFNGINQQKFDLIREEYKKSLAKNINKKCTSSIADAKRCCNSAVSLSPEGKVLVTESVIEVYVFDRVLATGVKTTVTVKIDRAACNGLLGSRRKKRSAEFFAQTLLLELLSDPTILNEIVAEVQLAAIKATGEDITLTAEKPITPQQFTEAPPTMEPTQAPVPNEHLRWIIPVAVIGGLILIAIIVVIVVVVVKKKGVKQVGPNDGEGDADRRAKND